MAPQAYISLYDDALRKFCAAVRADRIKDGGEDSEKQLREFLESRATAQQAKDSASVLQQTAGKKYGAKKIGDKEIISQKWIDNILGNIGNAIAVGDKLLKSTPESVSMAWFCVKLGLNAMQSNYQLYSLFGSGLTSMTEIMILIPHYDQLYDERQKPGFKPNELIEKLFRDVTEVYVAVLDFLFSIKRHLEASTIGKVRHAFKDFFGAEVSKFASKQDAIAALKAKVIEDSDGAFQGRLFDQLGNVQDSLKQSLDEIHTFASTAKELAQSQTDILRELQELKASVKPKTRWDWAKQEFDKYRKMLDPLPEVPGILRSLLDKRHPGTTQWIFENNKYMAWGGSHGSALLCLTGPEGAGKSVVLASANENIENTIDDTSAAICFVSCKTGNGSSNDMGTNPVDKIQRSLMYQVYRHAAEDEDKPDLLEECNKLFHHPKAKKQQQPPMNGNDDGSLPGICECVTKMAHILHKDVIFLVDAIDCLTSSDQSELFVAFGDVIYRSTHDQDSKISVRVLATCRSSGPFAISAFAKDSAIDIAEGNSQDMALHLSSAIQTMPDWTAEERGEAQAEVLNMAGSRFGYISDIAIPFLRQPFQRPLSRRLKALPQGITDSYKQAIRGMRSNYLDLLRTALTWTLYSAQPVRVKEVVESFSGVYDGLRTGDVLDGYSGFMATELELLQLQGASGPFLKISPNMAKQQIVTCQDLAQIRKFCEHTDEGTDHPASDEHCARCRANTSSTPSLELNEKQIHLDLALTLVRHLNNPTFQQRFDLLRRKVSLKDLPSNDIQSPEDEGYESINSPAAPHIDAVAGAEKERDLTGNDRKDDTSNGGTDTVDELKNGDTDSESKVTKAAIAENTSGYGDTKKADGEDGYDSDDSKEDEDYGEVDIIRKLRGQENEDEEDAPDGSWLFRYEINQWQHHFREADRLWSGEEKASSQQWTELIAELDKFAFENEPAFEAWQYKWDEGGGYLEKGVGALHVAAYLGLTYWVEHLVKALGKDPNEFSGGRNALQAAAIEVDNRDSKEMLRLLLSFPGADATVRGTSEPIPEQCALRHWLVYDSSEEVIKLLVDSGVDFNKTLHEESQNTALHYFAASKATDTPALKLILDSGGTEERPRPDINAKNFMGNTPLHFLMMRRDVPVDLLKAFIANGADINAENDLSVRPLQSACSWSEPGIVDILLENGIKDVDDGDDSGVNALHTAADVGSTECVRLLVTHGADISRKAKTGRGALHFAARHGHKDTVEALIELGADLNVGDAHARTPFWSSCTSDSKETAAAMLVALKPKYSISEINQPSKRGRTPLRLAATHGFFEICEELINMTAAAGLDVKAMLDIQDTAKGLTALHRATWRGELACVRLLLDSNTDATLKDLEGNSALMLATTQWQMSGEAAFEEIVFLLIDKDQEQAKVNSELPATAASNGSVRVLEKLYRIGADVNKPDVYGWTPLTLAQRLQKPDVEHFLKQQTAWGGTLPSAWVPHPAIKEIVTLSEDGLEIIHESGTQCTMSTDKPLPAGLDRYYFEVTSRKLAEDEDQPSDTIMAIGFCTFGAQYYQFPGWEPKRNTPSGRSWAYHGYNGGFYGGSSTSSQSSDEQYGPGDTVGCGVDLETRRIWYTKNGRKLDFEHAEVSGRLFPIIGLEEKVSLETNFGMKKAFVWAGANVNDEEHTVGGAVSSEGA